MAEGEDEKLSGPLTQKHGVLLLGSFCLGMTGCFGFGRLQLSARECRCGFP
jgi:hypothetical protein